MTAPRVFCYDKNMKYLVSGGEDTNVKIWDLRNALVSRQCLTTFKSHNAIITCVEISPDSRVLLSGAEDGNIIMYDMAQFKQIRAFKVGTPQSSYPVCIGVQRHESHNLLRGFAVGLLNKTIRYYSVD